MSALVQEEGARPCVKNIVCITKSLNCILCIISDVYKHIERVIWGKRLKLKQIEFGQKRSFLSKAERSLCNLSEKIISNNFSLGTSQVHLNGTPHTFVQHFDKKKQGKSQKLEGWFVMLMLLLCWAIFSRSQQYKVCKPYQEGRHRSQIGPLQP